MTPEVRPPAVWCAPMDRGRGWFGVGNNVAVFCALAQSRDAWVYLMFVVGANWVMYQVSRSKHVCSPLVRVRKSCSFQLFVAEKVHTSVSKTSLGS